MAQFKPRRKLVACVSTDEYRRMVADGELVSPGWSINYRMEGNTIAIRHATATVAVFSRGDKIFLCAPAQGARDAG